MLQILVCSDVTENVKTSVQYYNIVSNIYKLERESLLLCELHAFRTF